MKICVYKPCLITVEICTIVYIAIYGFFQHGSVNPQMEKEEVLPEFFPCGKFGAYNMKIEGRNLRVSIEFVPQISNGNF